MIIAGVYGRSGRGMSHGLADTVHLLRSGGRTALAPRLTPARRGYAVIVSREQPSLTALGVSQLGRAMTPG